ncbi:MAG TPA: hypothetical protein VKH37_01015, partial [Ferruginibacter sp.]|nr:hypothetical protein [Ferruginibacter sp.]
FIRLGKPTTSNGRLLVNSSDIFVRLKDDTSELAIAPGAKITLKYPESPVNTQMKFFVGDETSSPKFNWLPNPDLISNTVGMSQTNYEIQTNRVRWMGTNYFFDTANIQRVKIKASLANYFTNANTIAYVVFRDFRSVVAMDPDLVSRKFSTGLMPVGKLVTVVIISKQGNDFFMGFENITTANSANTPGEQTVTVTPVIKSIGEIIAFLNTL